MAHAILRQYPSSASSQCSYTAQVLGHSVRDFRKKVGHSSLWANNGFEISAIPLPWGRAIAEPSLVENKLSKSIPSESNVVPKIDPVCSLALKTFLSQHTNIMHAEMDDAHSNDAKKIPVELGNASVQPTP